MHMKCNENDKTMMNGENGFKLSERDLCGLCEQDFYPPQDDRVFSSGICDVPNGDSFYGYAEYFWDAYGCEIYDEI